MEDKLKTVLSESQDGQGALIPLLQKVQGELGYIPEEAIFGISEKLGMPAGEVFGVLTFYAQFRLEPQGRNVVRVCRGTACHVRGSARILRTLESHLGIRAEETSPDLEFTLEEIRCFGSCSLAPVIVVNQDTYGRLTAEKSLQIVERHRRNAEDN